ncbi:MAG: ribonuclease Z [Deltaproteobacteria bacterium]|nr:ribonuclease Z [Deltaproteobacteria bacterium]
MTPVFHPTLVNSPFEDPCLYVDFLFHRRAMLFDLGTLTALPPRKILRIGHVFVSHAHIDHFIGFDHLLRLCLGREKRVHLFGPPGFVDQVWHRLASYTWNLVYAYDTDFTIIASEVHRDGSGLSSEFHCLHGFKPESTMAQHFAGNLIHDEEGLSVRTAVLDHKTASLAFSLEEKLHVNIMKNRLDEMGLVVGPWLKELKAAIMAGKADDTPIRAAGREGITILTLNELREQAVRVEAGQKVCYVTDAAFTPDNAERIVALARDADYLFIEACFLEADAGRAAERCHLTARQAGELARRAGAARVIPFHFSPRYSGQGQELRDEVERAWQGE